MVIDMGKFMVAGFVQIETIVKVEALPLPYNKFVSVPGMVHTNVGGDGYSQSIALRWLGNDVDFMSMIGKNGHDQLARLNSSGVDLKMDYVLPILEAMPSAVILYNKGERQILEDVKDARNVTYDESIFEERIRDKDMVVISDANFCRPLLGLAKKYNKPIAVNVRRINEEKQRTKGDFLKAADIIYVSEGDIEGDPYECLWDCCEKYEPEIFILGLGRKGVLLYTREENNVIKYQRVKTNEIVNTVGEGDALFSAFLHYYVKTGNPKEAIKNALLFSSYKIGFVGTSNGFMTEEQIEQWKSLIWHQ